MAKFIPINLCVSMIFAILFGTLPSEVNVFYSEQVEYKSITENSLIETINPIAKVTTVEDTPEQIETVELTIEQLIENACDTYGIPYDITLAIARLETGWFKSEAYIYGNNPGGLSINEVPKAFDTIDEGVDAFVYNLANNYFNIGLTTPEEIGQKYCPVDPNWITLVSELMTYE